MGGSYGSPYDLVSSIEIYDPETDNWETDTSLHLPKASFAASACMINGKIYVIGRGHGFDVLSSIHVLDPGTRTWSSHSAIPEPRMPSYCELDGKIYVIGGCLDIKPPHPAVATVEVFTPE